MSCTAHVLKKYVKKYADGCWFNYGADDLNSLLMAYDVEFRNDSEYDCASGLEITDIESFKHAIRQLKKLPAKEKNEYLEGYTNEEIVGVFKQWLKCQLDDGYIRIEWF